MERNREPGEIVYRTDDYASCRERALVLKAMGIRHEIGFMGGSHILVVAATDAAAARAELDAYARERDETPHALPAIVHRGSGWAGVWCYAATLVLVAVLEGQGWLGFDWVEAGRTDAGAIRGGEWWRAITALTLHADVSHLLGNVVVGGLFGVYVGQLLGSGLGWFSILVGGALGNLINAWIRPSSHTSIGASTAVFAALGIVAAYAWVRRKRFHGQWLKRCAPLVGGVVLLSYFGTAGARTDVGAHVAGFLAGLAIGAIHGTLGDRLVMSWKGQVAIGAATLGALAGAWFLALTR